VKRDYFGMPVIAWLLFALIVIGVVHVAVLQFQHPDMTPTRLFLTFWPTYAVYLVASGLLLWVLEIYKGGEGK